MNPENMTVRPSTLIRTPTLGKHTGSSVAWGAFTAHQLQAAHEMQQGSGALKKDLNGSAKQRHLVEVQAKAAADQTHAVVQQEGHCPDSAVKHDGVQSVIDQVAVHDAAPEKMSICIAGSETLPLKGGKTKKKRSCQMWVSQETVEKQSTSSNVTWQ